MHQRVRMDFSISILVFNIFLDNYNNHKYKFCFCLECNSIWLSKPVEDIRLKIYGSASFPPIFNTKGTQRGVVNNV